MPYVDHESFRQTDIFCAVLIRFGLSLVHLDNLSRVHTKDMGSA